MIRYNKDRNTAHVDLEKEVNELHVRAEKQELDEQQAKLLDEKD